MSNLGNMAAPFLVTLSDDAGVKGVFIGGFVCIAGGLSMFFVKETKKKDAPENPLLENKDAEEEQIEEDKKYGKTISL